jgi:hypothetical protein
VHERNVYLQGLGIGMEPGFISVPIPVSCLAEHLKPLHVSGISTDYRILHTLSRAELDMRSDVLAGPDNHKCR